MLEQAIVDAEALREAALKNAEQVIIEKYSDEIKEAVQSLIEQPELEADPAAEEEMPMDLEAEEEMPMDFETEEISAIVDGLPPSHMEEEEESVSIELNLQELSEQLDKELGIVDSLEEESSEEEPSELEEDEEINLDDLLEDLEIDLNVVPHGHTGAPTETEREYAEDIAKAKEVHDELEKEKKEKKKLREQFETLKSEKIEILSLLKKYKNTVSKISKKLEETSISNAKLLYTNRILGSTSLNERQKTKIVEALSKSDSIEQAKVIYETLQNAVGEARKKKPKSLSEAVERRSLLTLPRTEKAEKQDPVRDRWKELAGIKQP